MTTVPQGRKVFGLLGREDAQSRYVRASVTTSRRWSNEGLGHLSAALAFFVSLSLAPLLLLLLNVGGRLFGDNEAQQQLSVLVRSFTGPHGAVAIATLLDRASDSARQGGTTALAIGSLVLGAAGMFSSLRDAFNVIWCVPHSRRSQWRYLVRRQAVAAVLVFVAGVLFIVLAGAMTLFANVRRDAPGVIAHLAALWEFLSLLAFFCTLALLLTFLFRFFPDGIVRWRDAFAGGIVTAVVFSLGQWLLAQYLGHAHLVARYGAGGTLVIVLLWIYFWTIVLLLGATFTEALSRGDGAGRA